MPSNLARLIILFRNDNTSLTGIYKHEMHYYIYQRDSSWKTSENKTKITYALVLDKFFQHFIKMSQIFKSEKLQCNQLS